VSLKSFRLYWQYPVVAPRRVVADYQPEELEQFRAEFRPVVERNRRLARIGYVVLAVAFASILGGWIFPNLLPWIMASFAACWLTLMLFAFLTARQECPACHNALDQGVGAYCPECGVNALQRGSWFRVPSCSSCGKEMRRGKGRRRHYKIRACTHCGVTVDKKGI
jgi:predicted RNA-binding Zn-ribbon protein involved in translation (DUF1610 family)